jgi:hypothetical protein
VDGPSENVLCVIIPFDDNLFKRAVGAVTLYSVGILGGGQQCSRWSKYLRTFNRENNLSMDIKLVGRFVCGMPQTEPRIREGITARLYRVLFPIYSEFEDGIQSKM